MVRKRDIPFSPVQSLTRPLTELRGVGPKRAACLAKKGLHTALDLLYFTPIRYEDRTRTCPLHLAETDCAVLVKGEVLRGGEEGLPSRRGRLFKIHIADQGHVLELVWFRFRRPHLAGFAEPGLKLIAYGPITTKRGRRQMIHPEIAISDGRGDRHLLGFYPVYSRVEGLSPAALRSIIQSALEAFLKEVLDPVPTEVRKRLGLPSLGETLRDVHGPAAESSIETLNRWASPSHRRLLFDRFFTVMLAIAFRRQLRARATARSLGIPSRLFDILREAFAFELTAQQRGAVEDLLGDMGKTRPMNRLLLGDVGCGKTVVAAAASFVTVMNQRQVALMVPSQILADQHMAYFSAVSPALGFRPVLLSAGLRRAAQEDVREKIREGHFNLVIGTQALIQEGVFFADLGLVVIDEQHRFGVRERALLDRKGRSPHRLVMTATPIPRTLAITLCGDMDISVIAEYPKGRLPVETHLVPRDRKRAVWDVLTKRLSAGQQAFVICPVIEASEETDLKSALEMAGRLQRILRPAFRVGLVHGRLPPVERAQVMADFRKGLLQVLVGTTVLEVGVHAPRATVMIIEHPERFGLAQLHQLRGRVGRGSEKGVCLLMCAPDLPEKILCRLKDFTRCRDGFEIARRDLELRGHGEFLGRRQSGMGELDLSDALKEPDLLMEAKREAERIVRADPTLEKPRNRHLRMILESVLSRPVDL